MPLNPYLFPEGQIVAFVLVLFRMIAFVFSMPIFGTSMVPMPVKISLPLVLTFVLFPLLVTGVTAPLAMNETVIALAAREIFVGLFLGFFTRLFFFAISIGGEIIGISSGLASSQIFNPTLGASTNILEQFQVMIATLIFLAMNGHHIFLEGLVRSYGVLPVGQMGFNLEAISTLAALMKHVMLLGLQIAAPVVLSVFLANIAMGIIGKAVPQINVLMTSMQATILLTFVVLIISLPVTVASMANMLDKMAGEMLHILKVI